MAAELDNGAVVSIARAVRFARKRYLALLQAVREARQGAPVSLIDIAQWLGPQYLAASGVARLAAQQAAHITEMLAQARVFHYRDLEEAIVRAAVVSGTATMPKSVVLATGKAAEPTLMRQFVALPCGQRMG